MSDETIEANASDVTEKAEAAPRTELAADGQVLAPPSRSAGTMIDLLEDGDLSAELYNALQEAGRQCRAISNSTNDKSKATITLKLDLEFEGEAFKIKGDIKTKLPDLPRRKSILWMDGNDDFTRFPPNQAQMFGARPVRVVGGR